MKLKKFIKREFSHHELRTLAVLCGCMALLVAAALVVGSANRPLALGIAPASQTASDLSFKLR